MNGNICNKYTPIKSVFSKLRKDETDYGSTSLINIWKI